MDGIGEQSRTEKWQARFYRLIGKKPPIRNWHVLYMGSTNRPDVLDPALTRPGRFDRSLEVSPPDKTGRREIISYYLSKIAHDETVDIEAIVADTNGATPARIMSAITKDAVRIALFAHKNKVSQRDIDLAFQEQYFGIESPIEEMEEDQRKVLAYHEAGHAIAQHYLMPDQRIVRVSIIRRGGAYGYMLPVDTKEWHITPLRRHVLDIMVSLAGRASEIVFFGEPFRSVGGDYANAQYNFWVLENSGMFGPPVGGQAVVAEGTVDGQRRSQGERARIIEQYWKNLESQVEQLLRVHAAEVHAVVNALLERSDLNSKEVVEIIETTRKKSVARGEDIPEALPQMMAQLLPHHQVMTPSAVPALNAPIIAKANGNGHEKVKSKPRARGSSRK
jgi:cell division protease FtsH